MSPDWAAKASPVPYATFGDPQSLNLYSYVRNNPLSKADADGHCDWCIDLAISIGAYVGSHPAVAQALGTLGDSMGMKGTVGVVARYRAGDTNVGGALSLTSEGRNDGTGKSAIQGTLSGQVAGAGSQLNVTGTFEKNGTMVNPLDNIGGNTKLTNAGPNGSSAQVGDDGRVALGLNVSFPPQVAPGAQLAAQAGIQVTAGGQEAGGVARAVGDAAISDTKQFVQDLHTSTTCGVGGCSTQH